MIQRLGKHNIRIGETVDKLVETSVDIAKVVVKGGIVADTRTPAQRSRIMASVRQRNIVRRLLYNRGYRYRLHAKRLPGKPDIVFPGRKKVIFVHGCFWHGHGCAKGKAPRSRLDYWGPKLEMNRQRDTQAIADLDQMGWKSLIVWQCETKSHDTLAEKLWVYLES
jgi:DNA mismatch endonuclease, patch repair protein